MSPGTEKLDSLLGDLLFLQEGLEHVLAKQIFERSGVDVFRSGMEDPVVGEDAEGCEGMAVRVWIQKTAEGLRRNDHRRHRFLKGREVRFEELERGHFDGVADDWTVAYEYAKIRDLYAARLSIPDRTEIESFVGPHIINGQGSYEFLHKHLNWPKPGDE